MPSLIAAARYLRMSTEHQRYSLEAQAVVIDEYAERCGFEIVETYSDPGRSGLTLKERPGLQKLLADVVSARRAFSAVLVVDVSRWGRFQDPDQAAHYEFLCREAGVQIHYCAEAFSNDESAASAIVKQVKRLMAAEYVRELSGKVTRAHLQQAALGFYQGGAAPYGTRRVIIDASGNPTRVLQRGERKAVSSERVILCWGGAQEVRVIRRIFRMFTQEGVAIASIADALNCERIEAATGGDWTRYLVRAVLRNELVLGNYIYNRTTQRLRTRRRKLPPEAHIRVKVERPIISRKVFALAARRLNRGKREFCGREPILNGLKRLLKEQGFISQRNVRQALYLPSYQTIVREFGSLAKACAAIGHKLDFRFWHGADGRRASDDDLLKLLKSLHERLGYVTAKEIDQTRGLPSATIYRSRFGSLRNAYKLAGLPYWRKQLARESYARRCAHGAPLEPPRGKVRPKHEEPGFRDRAIERLQSLYARDGFVSGSSLIDDPGPGPDAYKRLFGSLRNAYRAAGLPDCTHAELTKQGVRRRLEQRRKLKEVRGYLKV